MCLKTFYHKQIIIHIFKETKAQLKKQCCATKYLMKGSNYISKLHHFLQATIWKVRSHSVCVNLELHYSE